MATGMATACCTRDRARWTEDGPKAWSIVFGGFTLYLTVFGLIHTFSIFIVSIAEEFQVSRADIALVVTVCMTAFVVGGIFAGPMSDKYGVKPVLLVGWVMWVSGVLGATYCYEFGLLYLTQGILVGLGAGTICTPAMAVVPMWFNKYRGTASGLTALGSGLGNIIYALVGQMLLPELGWRATLRALIAVGASLALVAIGLMDRRFAAQKHSGGLFHVAKKLILLRSYKWFMVAAFFFQWGFYIPYIHMLPSMNDLGLSTESQGLALAMIGAGSSVGRVVTGPIADGFGRLSTFRMTVLGAGVVFATWAACITAESFYAFGFMYAFFAGGFIAIMPAVAGDLWGVENLGGTFVLVNLMSIPGSLGGGPVVGVIYETAGSYIPAIAFGSVCILLAGLAMFGMRKESTVVIVVKTTVEDVEKMEPRIVDVEQK